LNISDKHFQAALDEEVEVSEKEEESEVELEEEEEEVDNQLETVEEYVEDLSDMEDRECISIK
jgi:hypothetical protein